jgi:SAM-dependent methyltransferase
MSKTPDINLVRKEKNSLSNGDQKVTLTLQLILILLGMIIVLLGLLWIFVPVLSGLPWIPTHRERIYKALQRSGLHPGEKFYDLGAGDGRVLIIAAREFGARATGIELSPAHCILAWLRALMNGVIGQVSIRWGNFYKINLKEADVVFAYLTPPHATRLKPYIEGQLRPGSRLITISADIEGWEPTIFDSDDLIFIYQMPPTSGSLGSFLAKQE